MIYIDPSKQSSSALPTPVITCGRELGTYGWATFVARTSDPSYTYYNASAEASGGAYDHDFFNFVNTTPYTLEVWCAARPDFVMTCPPNSSISYPNITANTGAICQVVKNYSLAGVLSLTSS